MIYWIRSLKKGVNEGFGAKIQEIRKWPKEYLPKIVDKSHVDQLVEVAEYKYLSIDLFDW